MTWEELKKKAEALGYRVDSNDECDEELYNDDKGLCFFKNGEVCFWSIDEYLYNCNW